MRKLIPLTILIVAFVLQSCAKDLKNYESSQAMIDEAKKEVKFITAEEFKKQLDSDQSFYLIDCREPDEFDSVCIKGAINIPRGKIEEEISLIAPNHRQYVVVYCNNGDRSVLVAQILPEFKYSCVKVIEGGLENWSQKYPLDLEFKPVRGGGAKKVAKPAGGCGG